MRLSEAQCGWVLRDFHSPNLLWQAGALGTHRIGLIDYQDTVIGPVAYDVASLLLDARTDIDPELWKVPFLMLISKSRRRLAKKSIRRGVQTALMSSWGRKGFPRYSASSSALQGGTVSQRILSTFQGWKGTSTG
jgi:aminoglycoside phosphotransferase (APT) family kinase protein